MLYALLSGLGGGVDWEDRLTFGQGSALEMQGVGIYLGIVAGTTVGAPLGTYVALRRTAVTTATFALLQPGPQDPVIAPYAVFGGWFLVPTLVRYVVERRVEGDTGRDIDTE